MIATLRFPSKRVANRSFIISAFITSALLMNNAYSIGVKECELEAKTPLEHSYCEILEAGEGGKLPNFFEFRRNTESMQRLFLRGPAAKADITLPKASNGKVSTPPRAASTPSAMPAPEPPTTATDSYRASIPRANAKQNNSIGQCHLQKTRILCNTQQYFLAINIPVKRINASVFSAKNRLLLRPLSGQETAIEYLSDMYPYYIEKMLLLGLGDSTLSFTKFHAIYEGAQDNQAFRERFAEMYELLKKERQTMAVKSRYLDNYPSSIENCMPISAQLIACDNVAQNWVYRKVEMR